MFRYKRAEDRQITVDSKWKDEHFVEVLFPDEKKRTVHRKAEADFQHAVNYLQNVYVHVGGTYNSEIIPLWSLVSSFDGIMNTRFVTGREFVSHHSFGTAIDLNACMEVNKDQLNNRELIFDEVHEHLIYNGIKKNGNYTYYDFTYNGTYPETYCDVPETVINYLLYELAFYRSGFSWGYYYPHICDGMHFSLSDMDPDIHNSSDRSLRKVYTYAE